MSSPLPLCWLSLVSLEVGVPGKLQWKPVAVFLVVGRYGATFSWTRNNDFVEENMNPSPNNTERMTTREAGPEKNCNALDGRKTVTWRGKLLRSRH